MNHRYTVVFEAEPGGGYHASCPALPGCHAEGDTLDEATANVQEAIELYLESVIAHGEIPPTEDLVIRPVGLKPGTLRGIVADLGLTTDEFVAQL